MELATGWPSPAFYESCFNDACLPLIYIHTLFSFGEDIPHLFTVDILGLCDGNFID